MFLNIRLVIFLQKFACEIVLFLNLFCFFRLKCLQGTIQRTIKKIKKYLEEGNHKDKDE